MYSTTRHDLQRGVRVGYASSSRGIDSIESRLESLEILHESGESSCRSVARKAVIFPQKYDSVDHQENCSVKEFLAACKQNIQAEVWGFLQRSTHSFPGWRDKFLDFVTLEDVRKQISQTNDDHAASNFTFQQASKIKKGSLKEGEPEPVRLEEIASYLVIFRDHLCLTRSVRNEMEIMQGAHLDTLNKSDATFQESGKMYLIGYARPYVEDLATVLMFMNNILPAEPILRTVASPALRQPFVFDSRDFSTAVPSNPLQREIILRLSHDLEGVQGPPGTGPLPSAN
jgi:hypothetical protein